MKYEFWIFRWKLVLSWRKVVIFVVLLAITGLHGHFAVRAHWQENREKDYQIKLEGAKERYRRFLELPEKERKSIEKSYLEQYDADGHPKRMHREAYYSVNWSFPIFPMVILTNDSFTYGPLWGAGHISIYIDCFFTTFRIPVFMTWKS